MCIVHEEAACGLAARQENELEVAMAVMCSCTECGGDDAFQTCDNQLLKIQGDIARSKQRLVWLILLAYLLAPVGVMIAL